MLRLDQPLECCINVKHQILYFISTKKSMLCNCIVTDNLARKDIVHPNLVMTVHVIQESKEELSRVSFLWYWHKLRSEQL